MLREEVEKRLADVIRGVRGARGWEVKGWMMEKDHFHLFVGCAPRDPAAKAMNVLKMITSRELYEEFPGLRRLA